MSQSTFTGFRPELGLPWFSSSMDGLSPEQVAYKLKGCRSFAFSTADMAPAFPLGTQVVLRPVACRCKLAVGKVYVVLTKGGEFVACGRLTELVDSEEVRQWGVHIALRSDNGQPAGEPWIWPHPGFVLYAPAYYGSVDIAAL